MDMDVTYSSTWCVAPRCAGFTLVELMMTLAIIAILASTFSPAARLIGDTRLSNQVNIFAGHLSLARSEAIKHAEWVNICKSLDETTCDNSGQWHDGWIIFVDENRDRQRNPGEELIKVGASDSPSVTIDYGGAHTSNYVVYKPTGRSPHNGTFTFCINQKGVHPRALVLFRGRVRSAREMPDGSPLTCP